jgi:adenylosuccinate synthase
LANVVVIGAQWGDEGKGKITDLLSRSADVVVRYQGGVNAGHTIVVDDKVLKLHLIPSGILYPDTTCLIGSGTVVDPRVMLGELDMLAENGIGVEGLKLASTAHVTMPYHRLLDQAMEQRRGDRRIGTTGRGIGPTYADKAERNGIRVIDLLDEDRLRDRLAGPLAEKNLLLERVYGIEPLDGEAVIAEYAAYGQRLAPHVVDCIRTIHQAARARKNILFEGAQGTLLDLDHGTYPYVTSSNPISGGACIGAGVGPTLIDRVIGVAKAYTTRGGRGPLPHRAPRQPQRPPLRPGRRIRHHHRPAPPLWLVRWRDRPLCGGGEWPRLPGDHQARCAGCELDEIQVCVAYELDGQRIEHFPSSAEDFARCTPIFETLPGWERSTEECRRLEELPAKAHGLPALPGRTDGSADRHRVPRRQPGPDDRGGRPYPRPQAGPAQRLSGP